MANICGTQYKVMGERKAVADLWNTLQTMEVNTKNVYLYKLAEHYGIDYEKMGISVRGHIYWAEFEADEDICLLSFDTESAWSACEEFFDELNKVLGGELSVSYREIECGCDIFYVHGMLVRTSLTLAKMLLPSGVRRWVSRKVTEPMMKWWISLTAMSMRTRTPIII